MVFKNNLPIGKLGEEIAKNFLEDKGYSFIEQNYRNKYAEIDLIMKYEDALIFIEVKTRIGEQFGAPEDALNRNKINRLVRNANMYAMRKKCDNYRIDGVCIVLDEEMKVQRINHHKDINF